MLCIFKNSWKKSIFFCWWILLYLPVSGSRVLGFYCCNLEIHSHKCMEILSPICLRTDKIRSRLFIFGLSSFKMYSEWLAFVLSNWYHFRSLNLQWQESIRKKTHTQVLFKPCHYLVLRTYNVYHLISPLKCHRDFLYWNYTSIITASDIFKCFFLWFLILFPS